MIIQKHLVYNDAAKPIKYKIQTTTAEYTTDDLINILNQQLETTMNIIKEQQKLLKLLQEKSTK